MGIKSVGMRASLVNQSSKDETRFILSVLLCSILIDTAYSTGARSVQIEVKITAMGWEEALIGEKSIFFFNFYKKF